MAAVVAVLLVAGLVAARVLGSASEGAQARQMRSLHAGDCITILPRPDKGRGATGGMNITHDKVACNTPGAVTYTVGSVAHGRLACPNANYQEYWEDDEKASGERRLWTACLVPNLAVGSCYEPDSQTRAMVVAKCGPNSLFRVESDAPVDDPRRCTGVAEPFSFPDPARTYCVTSLT